MILTIYRSFPSHDIHSFYLTLHESARNYKEKVKIYNSKRRPGKEPKKARSVEMDNFQDPQVRSICPTYFLFFDVAFYLDIKSATFGMGYLSRLVIHCTDLFLGYEPAVVSMINFFFACWIDIFWFMPERHCYTQVHYFYLYCTRHLHIFLIHHLSYSRWTLLSSWILA